LRLADVGAINAESSLSGGKRNSGSWDFKNTRREYQAMGRERKTTI